MSHNLIIDGIEYTPVEKISIPTVDGSKVEFIVPSETINITSNVRNKDITNGKLLNVNVPVPDNYIDKSKVTHFATGTVSNVTAGQKMTVTGIKDVLTGEAFTPQGVLAYIEVTSNSWINTPNYEAAIPAVFCFVRDNRSKFGVAMACGSSGKVREVRFNTDIGGVSSSSNSYITFSGNSFTYISTTNTMYGLLAASKWRWVAWG